MSPPHESAASSGWGATKTWVIAAEDSIGPWRDEGADTRARQARPERGELGGSGTARVARRGQRPPSARETQTPDERNEDARVSQACLDPIAKPSHDRQALGGPRAHRDHDA